MKLQWTADLSVSNDRIDKEHQRWIELFNNFYNGIAEGRPKEKLEELVLGMLDYTKYHFKSEEEYMRSVHYPGLAEHQETHNTFIKRVEEFHQKITSGKLILSLEVTNFLKTWLIDHIKGSDLQYARFAQNK